MRTLGQHAFGYRLLSAVLTVLLLRGFVLGQTPATPPPSITETPPQSLPDVGTADRPTAPASASPWPVVDAEVIPKSSAPFGGPLLERSKLTGDWFDLRNGLQDHGITIDVSSTQFYQGVTSGGLERSFPYGGRNDYFLNLDGEKLGLWDGLAVRFHGETRYGETASFTTGALSPVNEYLLVPGFPGTVSGLTGAELSQTLSENLLVSAGKINLLDHIQQPLTGATGLEGFMNTSLIFNPILARTLPYSAFGVAGAYLQEGDPVLSLSVFDSRDASTTSVFHDFFNNGAVIFGTAHLPTNLMGLPGHQGVEGVYSSGQYTNISKSPYLDPVEGLVFPDSPKSGSWALGYVFDQALWAAPDDPKRVWGIFGKLGLSDGNPNPIRWNAGGGISGASPIPGRTRDTFGVGFYDLAISDTLKRSATPLTPLQNEQGVELYYNARITPWFQFTPDLQIVRPFEKDVETAIVVGFRAKLDF